MVQPPPVSKMKRLRWFSMVLMSMICYFFVVVESFPWNVNFSNLIFTGTLGKIFLLVAVDPFLKLTNRNYKNNKAFT